MDHITAKIGRERQQRDEIGEGESNKICRFDDLSHFLRQIRDSMFLAFTDISRFLLRP